MGSLFPFFPLMLFSAVVMLAPFLAMFEVYTRTKPYPGYGFWTLSLLMFSAGSLLLGLRGFIPDFLSIVASNVLLVAGMEWIRQGLARFFGLTANWTFAIGILLVFAAIQSFFTYVHDDIWARTVLFSVTHATLLVQCLRIGRRNWKHFFPGQRRILFSGSLYGLLALHLLRLAAIALAHARGNMPSAFAFLGLSTFSLMPLSLVLAFSLLSMHTLRLYQDREAAWAEVRVLGGLLPICSSCKKIRNDAETWENLESYISKHSEATFSHGLCPDCVRRLYPEIADED